MLQVYELTGQKDKSEKSCQGVVILGCLFRACPHFTINYHVTHTVPLLDLLNRAGPDTH